MQRVKVVVLLALVACSSSAKPGPSESPKQEPPPSNAVETPLCTQFIDRLTQSAKAEGLHTVDEFIAIYQRRCPGWPEPVQRCVVDAKGGAMIEQCVHELPPAEYESLERELSAAASPPP